MRIDHAQKEQVEAGIKFAASQFAGLPAGMSEEERREYWADGGGAVPAVVRL